ncbi:hypothetical protein [Microcoleus sp. PH2017_02_FOX_O_A]|uniref:hypothetical protein n=1 Tax=Microcoleus sp. PH2017_02_FOX_O_A TaxID=2798813 RepID=UPI001DDA00C4|nr:hypothetical protein [Microcoleus sp. PH2017_02_FOX_O_A]MCC3411812.1 hypothetical protein [Microcoleus sp. PH2017_02_FOX_O_A]
MPFPYSEIITRGDGNAVSLPGNNHEHSMRDVTIARLIVGKRHCRVLKVGKCATVLTSTADRTKSICRCRALYSQINPQQPD